jgi:nuclear pore complex protein Nup93
MLFQSGVIEQGATLLQLQDSQQFNEQILVRAAQHSEENDRISEAIKLYNLAGDYSTVITCLARALGNTVVQPSVDEKGRAIEKTAADILRHYERMNRAVGKDREAVIKLLRIREAVDAKNAGRPEIALDVTIAFEWDFLGCLLNYVFVFVADHGVDGSDPSGWRCC